MLSWGMFASLADSMAALSRMLIFGSPPPFFAATVISRRIFENSFPRCTSALPFFRLICDHRECPDIALSSFVRNRRFQSLHTRQPLLAPDLRRLPPPPLRRRFRRERVARSGTEVLAEVHVGEIGRARVPDLARLRLLRQHLHAGLDRRRPHVVEP